MDCLFCKLRDQTAGQQAGPQAGKAVYEDEQCFVLQDLHPQAPLHLLVLPKKHLAGLGEVGADDEPLLGHLLRVAAQLARERGVADDGYRVVVNHNAHGGQTVFHLHVHLLGGRQMAWPPG
jgi:histidine triad (HIT) family protein